jgi:hypothetical protein
MTNFYGLAGIDHSSADIAAAPGAAPLGTGAMQGNPQTAQAAQVIGQYPPTPQVGGAGQALGITPAAHDLISRGAVPLSVVPTSGAVTAPGTDSLLAQIARGQVIFGQAAYGINHNVPQGGDNPQTPLPNFGAPVPVFANPASSVTVANPANYTGN